jgi:hypothetical protein
VWPGYVNTDALTQSLMGSTVSPVLTMNTPTYGAGMSVTPVGYIRPASPNVVTTETTTATPAMTTISHQLHI